MKRLWLLGDRNIRSIRGEVKGIPFRRPEFLISSPNPIGGFCLLLLSTVGRGVLFHLRCIFL
jgi:hypothetical protein